MENLKERFYKQLDEKLEKLKSDNVFRDIKNIDEKTSKFITIEGKKMLNLSSNDYLNLSTDKDLKNEFIEKYSLSSEFIFSSASSRLLTGNSKIYNAFERNIAKLFKKEAALLFNTGYQCNQGVISSLLSKNDLILSDKLNHASIVSGLKLSNAQHIRFPHRDYDNLEKILKEKRSSFNNVLIISESVYSMDGDIANIKKLVEIKKKYDCLLMLDEAHAFGVFGDNLAGVSDKLNLLNEIDIITITLGKSLASMGAVCLSSKNIINYLINYASSFIFSTALPSINVMWSNFLIEEKFEVLRQKKEKLNDLFTYVHKIYPTISSSQIIPVILKDAGLTKSKALELQSKGFYVLPINPPTVPLGTSRLRVSLCADINEEEIKEFFNAIQMA